MPEQRSYKVYDNDSVLELKHIWMPIANKIVKDAVYIKYLKFDSELVIKECLVWKTPVFYKDDPLTTIVLRWKGSKRRTMTAQPKPKPKTKHQDDMATMTVISVQPARGILHQQEQTGLREPAS